MLEIVNVRKWFNSFESKIKQYINLILFYQKIKLSDCQLPKNQVQSEDFGFCFAIVNHFQILALTELGLLLGIYH